MTTSEDRLKLAVVIVNACAAVIVVALQDPALRRDLATYLEALRARARTVYRRPMPAPRDVSAVLRAAEGITRAAVDGEGEVR